MRHLNQALLLPQARIDAYAIGIIGTGAIGSFVAMALTKMGFSQIVTWDPDKIEVHNLDNQMFPVESVGTRKALATRAMVKQFSGEDIVTMATKTTGRKAYDCLRSAFPGKRLIMILAVDSLDTRKDIVRDLRRIPDGIIVIDARMGAKTYRVMGFQPAISQKFNEYMATIVPDADAVQERCGQKSIIYTVLGVAAEVCAFVHSIVMPPEAYPFAIPHPVTFDYGTGIRLQQVRAQGEVLDFTEDDTLVEEAV